MITVPVTCTASDQNGNPVAGARVTAKLNQTEVYQGLIVPESITAVADASGVAILNLWPNALGTQGSMYRITATNPDTGRKYLDATVSVPNSACNLHQIMLLEPYPAIDASAQALAAAQGVLALVTAQAGIATTQATNVSTSAGNAATSATNAGASATAASGSAVTASNSASTATTSAGTATSQAGVSTLRASEAATSAATATTQAGIATTQAGLATTNGAAQVTLATAQAALATTQANNAAGSAANSVTSANAASNSASTATAQAGNAATSATASANSATTATTQATNAGNSATGAANSASAALLIYGNTTAMQSAVTTATTKANEASTSAGTATTQASTATTQASSAAGSATNAANSATAANTSAGTAFTAATTATTQAGNASSSATAAGTSATQGASSATASALSATNAGTSQTSATASATLSTTNANTATTQNTASGNSASAAAASATASAAARDLSIAAWAASTAPAETLAAMSQSIHVGAVVKAIIYETQKDSDGGIWRKRCTDKSWFTEAMGGNRSVGQRASVGAAWTAAGSATGAIYQSTADGKHYTPTSSTTQTEVFRGIVSEFPAKALIVAESARVVIYDLSTGAMWMVFVATSGFLNSRVMTALAAVNGEIYIGRTSQGWANIRYLTDECWSNTGNQEQAASQKWSLGISGRNSSSGLYILSAPDKRPNNGVVNDIAVTVLENAPIDPATGMPVPTVYVSTNGGVSVIGNTGTVTNIATPRKAFGVVLDGPLLTVLSEDGTQTGGTGIGNPEIRVFNRFTLVQLAVWNSLSTPWIGQSGWDFKSVMAKDAIGGSYGSSSQYRLNRLKLNPTSLPLSMVAHITNAYNSGWQVGDSRFCGLADVVAETITAPELVVNGTAPASAANWTPMVSGTNTASVSGGEFVFQTVDGLTDAQYTQNIATVIGKTYRVTMTARTVGGRTAYAFAQGQYINISVSANTTGTSQFVATSTSTPLIIAAGNNAGGTSYVSFISVKLADADRSVKANGLAIVGSLTKTAVATGAQLVAYSGFSGTNYLEQPYSANLDFGTGDFCVMGWDQISVVATARYRFSRGIAGVSELLGFSTDTSGVYRYSIGSTSLASTGVTQSLGNNFICYQRVSGVLYLYVNAVLVFSVANTSNLTSASATLRIGSDHLYLFGATPMALWRITATAPSADQIAQIYRDELALFQPNAQCTLAGTSTAVTALTYDESTDLLHVGTSWGRSAFKSLLRTESEATTTGSITSLSASQGTIVTGGTSAKIYQPALQLRDELARKEEARRALGKVPVFIDFTATVSQTAFVLAKGYTVKGLYKNGTLMRETTTGVFWTRSNDGYQETATLSVGATVGDWISLMCIRSN